MRAAKRLNAGLCVGVVIAGIGGSLASATPVISLTDASLGAPLGFTELTNNTVNSTNGSNVGNFSATSASNVLFLSGGSNNYLPSYVTGINNTAVGGNAGDSNNYLQVSGFNPSSDKEIYALKLDVNGAPADATDIQAVIDDINAAENTAFYGAAGTQLATHVTGSPVAQFFPGYSLLINIPYSYLAPLLVNSSNNPEFDFGFDLSDFTGSTEAPSGTVTVTDIGVIPEPASVAIIGFLAIPALLSRRRSAV
jgi:hypothetical protein